MVHASPRDPMWEYLLDLFDAAECFPLFSSRYCFVGHTHVPLVFRDMDGIVKAAIPEFERDNRAKCVAQTDGAGRGGWPAHDNQPR